MLDVDIDIVIDIDFDININFVLITQPTGKMICHINVTDQAFIKRQKLRKKKEKKKDLKL